MAEKITYEFRKIGSLPTATRTELIRSGKIDPLKDSVIMIKNIIGSELRNEEVPIPNGDLGSFLLNSAIATGIPIEELKQFVNDNKK